MDDRKDAPWLKAYGGQSFHLEYPEGSMVDVVFGVADEHKNDVALSCSGKKVKYSTFKDKVVETANAFYALGIRKGDKVTICLPNLFQTVYSLYALNYLGAVPSLIHPLSAEKEIAYYLDEVGSDVIITLDIFYKKIAAVEKERPIKKVVVCGAADELGVIKKCLYKFVNRKKLKGITLNPNAVWWKDLIKNGKGFSVENAKTDKNETAVILFSGGTTGVTKGIKLSNLNFNALALQTMAMCSKKIEGSKMLAAMPCFHGFGLGVCVHTVLVFGGESILVPVFNVRNYAKLIKTQKPNYIAGVPTLYEALTRTDVLDKTRLDFLYGVFSGGDSLSVELKKKLDKYLADRGATVRVREGYGLTECVTASCLTPHDFEKEGSIGIPFPDTYYKICAVGTTKEVPYGKEGEICISGPTVMLGYYNRPDEDAITLVRHDDGETWLHTGDLGFMDEDGFIYYRQRIKRMIVTSGYNVYPSQVENVIDAFPAVQMSCVIGVRDDYKMQRVKAFVTLKKGFEPSEELKAELKEVLKQRIVRYAIPKDIEFRDSLPLTLVGKVAVAALEKEEAEKTK